MAHIVTFLLRINMQGTRHVSEATSAFESYAPRHIVPRRPFLLPFATIPFPFPLLFTPQHLVLIPLNSPYMIHEAHSSAIRWHDTHPTTVPWNHAPWSRYPRLRRYTPFLSLYPFVETLLYDDIYDTASVHHRMQLRYLRSNTGKLIKPTKIFLFDKICRV